MAVLKRNSMDEGSGSATKRPRLETCKESENLFDETRRKNAIDLLDSTTTDDTGNLEAKIHMVFPRAGGTRQLNLEMSEHGNTHRFLVVIASKVLDKLRPFPFRPSDSICLSLKGAHIARRADSSAPFYLPVALTFNDGLAVMLLSGPETGKIFNTWKVDWFDGTINIPRVADIVMQDASAEYITAQNTSTVPSRKVQTPQAKSVASAEVPTPVHTSHESRNSSPFANVSRTDPQLQEMELTKAQKRRRRRKGRDTEGSAVQAPRQESGSRETTAAPQKEVLPSPAPPPPAAVQSPPQVPTNERTSSSSRQTSSSTSPKPSSNAVTVSPPALVNDSAGIHRHGALAMKAGLITQGGDQFSALRKISPGFANVIGVVVSTKPSQRTSTNEWARSFSLVDPSYMENDANAVRDSFPINCFQKKHLEWLPQAEVGDIILVRRVKVSMYKGGINGVGYGDQLRWVTYDPLTRRFRVPDIKDAPHSETLNEGFGYTYSPFYMPDVSGKEAEYCAQLADWWQVMQAKDQSITTIQCAPPTSRQHRLISEVTPDTFPQGYFNCTVEILFGYDNSDGPYSIYVTDYTANSNTYPVKANWCQPELSTYAFRMQMWDNAALLAKTMQPGEYWYLPNTRMMARSYFEGKLVETYKAKRLDETQSDNPQLRALLERKKKFQGAGANDSSTKFEDKLIEDVDAEVQFFGTTVEVLHVDLSSAEEPLAYVTDYTFNPDLVNPAEPVPWAFGLDCRIVKIILEGRQKERVHDLHPGTIYRIRNLRLIRRKGVKAFGYLGGDERLIIEVKDCEREEVKALLQRKEKWKIDMRRDGVSIKSAGNASTEKPCPPTLEIESAGNAPTEKPRPPTPEASENVILKDVIASPTDHSKITFVARVKDFYPLLLDDAAYLRCMKCNTDLRPRLKCCLECDDMLNTHCKWFYELYFRLEDDEGCHVTVSLAGKECELLSGLPATDSQTDRKAFDSLVDRLKPIIGNLREVHDGYTKKKESLVITPKMRFTVESWSVPGKKRAYGLLGCVPL